MNEMHRKRQTGSHLGEHHTHNTQEVNMLIKSVAFAKIRVKILHHQHNAELYNSNKQTLKCIN